MGRYSRVLKLMANPTVTAAPPNNDQAAAIDENPFTQQAASEARKPVKRSLLESVITGKKVRPLLTVLYGPPGVGKTTWASKAPNPIFIPTERGVDQVGATQFPIPKTFNQFYSIIRTIANKNHKYQTLVIDTANNLKTLI